MCLNKLNSLIIYVNCGLQYLHAKAKLSDPAQGSTPKHSTNPVQDDPEMSPAQLQAEVRNAISEHGYWIGSKEKWCSNLSKLAGLSSTTTRSSASAWGIVERVLDRQVDHSWGGRGVFHDYKLVRGRLVTDFGGNQRMQIMHPGDPPNQSLVGDWNRLPAAERDVLERIYEVHGLLQNWLKEMFPDRLGLTYMHSPEREGVKAKPQVAHPDVPFNIKEQQELSQVSTIVAGEYPASLWVLPESHKFMIDFWEAQFHNNDVGMQDALRALSKIEPVLVHMKADSRMIFHKYLLHGGPAKGRARVHEYWGGAKKSQSHPNLIDLSVPLIGIDPRFEKAVKPF